MRQSQSAVLERGYELEKVHTTEPFEVAWAGEARWYVQFLREAPQSRVVFHVQISPDGITWLDHESAPAVETPASGILSIPVERFGHWLRLRAELVSGNVSPLVRVYLELKE
jgi:hypothetical protein